MYICLELGTTFGLEGTRCDQSRVSTSHDSHKVAEKSKAHTLTDLPIN